VAGPGPCCLLISLLLLASGQKRRPTRVDLRQDGQQDLAVVEQNDTNLSFKLQVRRQRPTGSQTRQQSGEKRASTAGEPRTSPAQARQSVTEKPAESSRPQSAEQRRPATGERREVANGGTSVSKQREGVGFVHRQRQRGGGPRQSVAVSGELFAERSRPVTGGGRRTGGAQPAPQSSAPQLSVTPAKPAQTQPRKSVRKKKKKAARPAASRPKPRPAAFRPTRRPAAVKPSAPRPTPSAPRAAAPADQSSSSGGPRIYELDDAEIDKILQDARQIGRSQRLINSAPAKGRSVRRRKKSRVAVAEQARSTLIEDSETIPAANKGGHSVKELLGKMVVKSQPVRALAFRGRHQGKPTLPQEKLVDDMEQEENVRFRSRSQFPRRLQTSPKQVIEEEKGDRKEVSAVKPRFRPRGQLPRKQLESRQSSGNTASAQGDATTIPELALQQPKFRSRAQFPQRPQQSLGETDKTGGETESSQESTASRSRALFFERLAGKNRSGEKLRKDPGANKIDASHKKPEPTGDKSRFKSRSQFPQRPLQSSVQTTTNEFNSNRFRNGVLPKIDPRGKETHESKDPLVSVSVSHSVSVEHSNRLAKASTTPKPFVSTLSTLSPSFSLLEPRDALPSTESYQDLPRADVSGAERQLPTTIAPLSNTTPQIGMVSSISQTRSPIKDDLDELVTTRIQKHRRRGQVPRRTTGGSKESDIVQHQLEQPRKFQLSQARDSSRGRPRKEETHKVYEVDKHLDGRRIKGRDRKVTPYQRSREPAENQPKPYQSKIYGLLQVPSATDEYERPANRSYLDVAINHAEVTWSQDPFRQDSLLVADTQPLFDIDYTKDPTRSGELPTTENAGIDNLFASKNDASNAINQFYKGTFVFDKPVVRTRTISGSRKAVPAVAAGPVVISTEANAPQIPIKLFDPFTFYRNL